MKFDSNYPNAQNAQVVAALNRILRQTDHDEAILSFVANLRDQTIRLQCTDLANTGLPFLAAVKFLNEYEQGAYADK